MDTKIKLFILCLLASFGLQAQTPAIGFAAKFQITSATGGDPYNIVGIVSDDLSRFTGSDVQINDSIYIIDGSDLYVLAVTSITSVVGPTVTLVANDPLDAGVSIPTGQAAILRPTNNYTLPVYISGLRDDLRSMIMNRQAQLIDEITGGGLSITDFISAGVAVPPSAPANLNDGETWRNSTTGELWASDGVKWYPFNYGPKECVDTVTNSLITVQSGGIISTGSPLVRNSSGVWEHLYNHATPNLIPDGVVTDVIVGPRAIIQYCGVRKGSGATPNTSYYVDQTANTGFTTTKPTTNIRPLGKVSSNGDFLVNAGLLFSRDNAVNTDSTFVKLNNSYNNKRITDTIQRTAPLIAPIWDKGGAAYNVAAYGIFPDGTDQTAKIQTLLDTVYNRGGGTVQFGEGTYRINGLLKPKTNYNGSNIPQTPDMIIKGTAGFQSGNGQKPIGGTILDMRYQGDTIGCFQFRGTGKVVISDITFLKGTTGLTNTFIHSTLTTLHIHDCAFLGFNAVNRNRAIVLGGNTAFLSSPDTSAEMGFQGYGTVIESNYFNWISTGVLFQTYANAVVVSNNNFWNGCGGYAAIWFAAKNDTNTGNVVQNNLIEMNNYTYGVYLGALALSNTVSANNFFDGPGTSINVKSVTPYANTILEGFNGIGHPYIGSSSVNTRIAMSSGDTSTFSTNILLNTGNYLGLRGGYGERIYGAIPDEYGQTRYADISGVKNLIWNWNAGSTGHQLVQIQDYQPTKRFTILATETDEFGEFNSSGNMRIKVKTDGELWMGDNSQRNHLFLSGILYGGMSSGTIPFKLGLSDKIHWGDATSPLSGNGAGLTSTTANILRTIDGSVTDARHQALEFYATGTGVNQIPVGNTAQRTSGSRGMIRNNLQTGKFEGVRVGTSYERFFMLEDTLGATSGQVLAWNGSAWAPATNTSESTSIGAFNNTGTSNGLSLTGTALSLHAATISTPGGFNITQQTVYAGTGTKRIVANNGVQLDVDDELGTKSAGIRYTELDAANVMAQTTVSSPDADHGTIVTKVEDGAATLVTYQEIGSLDDKRGIYEGGGLYEDVKSVTAGTYTVLYGDRNLHLDGTSMVVTLQVIGTGAGETKPGRVITFFNDNATSVTINGGGGQDIVDASSLTLIVNTGVTLIASGSKWIIKD